MLNVRKLFLLSMVCVMGLSLNACLILEATTDTAVQISDAVTHATTDILSSTSGSGGHSSAEARAKKIRMFAKHNARNVQQDVAQGGGEYLASLEALLEVPPQRHDEFTVFAQSHYEWLVSDEDGITNDGLMQLADFGSQDIAQALSVQIAAK
ncbi:DUF3015 family protein [Nitrospira sp. M1]